ncbi:MAG: GNAT family N-acetyltransferase [Candidatus Hermodarchaeota archaeon]
MPQEKEIITYSEDLADEIADLFNRFDSLWPASFTQGVPYTNRRVKEEYNNRDAVALLFVKDGTGKLQGFCSVFEHWKDPEAAYVGVLGVSPEVLGKGYGKTLLLHAIKICCEKGFQRLDLNTWAGNLKAVPLYKKTGFFWVPETSVSMENYIPGILAHPLCKPFFEKHDWYQVFKRELEQAPDDQKESGIPTFIYHFKNGEDWLKCSVNKPGRCISSIERNLDGKKIKISAQLKSSTVYRGMRHSYVFAVENGTEKDLEVSAFLIAPSGISLEKQALNLSVPPSEAIKNSIDFSAILELEKTRSREKSPTIRTQCFFSGEQISLETGMEIKSPIDVETRPNPIILRTGSEKQVHLILKNNTEEALKGSVNFTIDPNKVHVNCPDPNFELKPKEKVGLNLTLQANSDVKESISLFVNTQFASKTIKGSTMNEEISVLITEPLFVQTARPASGEGISLINDHLKVDLEAETGSIIIRENVQQPRPSQIRTRFQIGPPFGIVPVLKHDYKTEIRNGTYIGKLTTQDVNVKGVFYTLQVKLGLGSLIEVAEIVENKTNKLQQVGGRLLSGEQGIHLGSATTTIPTPKGILSSFFQDPYISYPSIPKSPEFWKEGWMCQTGHLGASFGQIWNQKNIKEVQSIGKGVSYYLQVDTTTLQPGERKTILKTWYILGISDYREVRQIWARLTNQDVSKVFDNADGKTISPLEIKMDSIPLLNNGETNNLEVKILNNVGMPVRGQLFFKEQNGEINSQGVEINEIAPNEDKRMSIQAQVDTNAKPGISWAELSLITPERRFKKYLPVIFNQKGKVNVNQVQDEQRVLFEIDNGCLKFKTSPNFGASLFGLQDAEGTTYLLDSYPQITKKIFIDTYLGGIQPIHMTKDTAGISTEMHMEKIRAQRVTNDSWQGVTLSYQAKKSENLQGLFWSISYLTMPNLPLIKVIQEVENRSTVYNEFMIINLGDFAINGGLSNEIVSIKTTDSIVTSCRGSKFPTAVLAPSWIQIKDPETNKAISYISTPRNDTMVLSLDIGPGGVNAGSLREVRLKPQEKRTYIDYISLDASLSPEKLERFKDFIARL